MTGGKTRSASMPARRCRHRWEIKEKKKKGRMEKDTFREEIRPAKKAPLPSEEKVQKGEKGHPQGGEETSHKGGVVFSKKTIFPPGED